MRSDESFSIDESYEDEDEEEEIVEEVLVPLGEGDAGEDGEDEDMASPGQGEMALVPIEPEVVDLGYITDEGDEVPAVVGQLAHAEVNRYDSQCWHNVVLA